MDRNWTIPQRASAAAITVLVVLAFAIQAMINEGPPLVAFALLFRFFTIWSNFAAGLLMLWIALDRRMPERIIFALATALSVVALVYHALLAADHHPVGLDWWANLAFHTLTPAATILWWLVSTRGLPFTITALPGVMVAPITYTVFALIYGAATGFYAYFFLDPDTLGWALLLGNMVGLAIFFMIMGAVLMGLRSLLHKAVTARA